MILSLVGCATTRLGTFTNDYWYVVGVEDDVEVQANQIPAELDYWYIRINNLSDTDYHVLVDWRTMDYEKHITPGWILVPAHQWRDIGYFKQREWLFDGKKLQLNDAVIKVESIELEEVQK